MKDDLNIDLFLGTGEGETFSPETIEILKAKGINAKSLKLFDSDALKNIGINSKDAAMLDNEFGANAQVKTPAPKLYSINDFPASELKKALEAKNGDAKKAIFGIAKNYSEPRVTGLKITGVYANGSISGDDCEMEIVALKEVTIHGTRIKGTVLVAPNAKVNIHGDAINISLVYRSWDELLGFIHEKNK